MRSQIQTSGLPGSKVVGHRNGPTAGPLVDAVRNVLPESRRASNRRLVGLLVLPDLVRASVGLEGAEILALGRSLAVGGVLLDVVLDQGVACPAVDRH